MRFNKAQNEGFARACDTLAVSAIIGAIVGITGHSFLLMIEIFGLMIASWLLLTAGYFFRRKI
jgi:uncharacterized membrane protein